MPRNKLGTLAAEAGLTLICQLATAALTFAITILSARALGVTGQGQFFLGWTFGLTILQFANLGLHSSNVYQVGRSSKLFRPLLVNSAYASVIAGGLAYTLSLAGCVGWNWYVGSRDSLMLMVVGGLLAPAQMYFLLVTNLVLATGQVVRFNVLNLIRIVLQVFVAVLCLWKGVGATIFLGGQVFANYLVLFPLLKDTRSAFHENGAFEYAVFLEGARFAIKSYVACLFGFLILRTNVYLIESMLGAEKLGFYSVALQLVNVIVLLATSVRTVLYPRLVRNLGEDDNLANKTLYVVGLICVAISLLLGLLADQLIPLAYGQEFLESAHLLRLLLPGAVFWALVSVQSATLASLGFPMRLVWMWFWVFIVSLPVFVLSIQRAGIEGACVAYSIVCLWTLVAQTYVTQTHIGRPGPSADLVGKRELSGVD